jgi:hypothetical protein
MHPALKKILILILTCSAGFFVAAALLLLSHKAGLFPDIDSMTQDNVQRFKLWFFGGTMWAWLIGALISIGYILSDGPKKKWFLGAPIYMPVIYVIGAITYYM